MLQLKLAQQLFPREFIALRRITSYEGSVPHNVLINDPGKLSAVTHMILIFSKNLLTASKVVLTLRPKEESLR